MFKIPQLRDASEFEDVYIPREHIRGISVKHGEASNEDMQTIGFQAGQKAAAAGLSS